MTVRGPYWTSVDRRGTLGHGLGGDHAQRVHASRRRVPRVGARRARDLAERGLLHVLARDRGERDVAALDRAVADVDPAHLVVAEVLGADVVVADVAAATVLFLISRLSMKPVATP